MRAVTIEALPIDEICAPQKKKKKEKKSLPLLQSIVNAYDAHINMTDLNFGYHGAHEIRS